MCYLILGNGQNEQVSDRFCPILSGGGGGGGVNFGHAKSAVKKNSFVYVSMWLIFLLDNCLTKNCLTRLHTYIHTYIHTSIQTPQWPDKSLRLDGATNDKYSINDMHYLSSQSKKVSWANTFIRVFFTRCKFYSVLIVWLCSMCADV